MTKYRFHRLVSLVPSTTETVFALGAGHRLVGVTDYCVQPDPMPDHVARLGGPKNPNLALIRELAPDLVLASREENRAEDVAALASWTRVHLAQPRSVAEAIIELVRLGHLLDRESRATELAQSAQAAVLAVKQVARPFRFVYLVWRAPWMAAGPGTYISDFVGLGGGENVVPPATPPAASRYPVVDPTQLAGWRPEVIFLPDEPYPFDYSHAAEIEAFFGAAERPELLPVRGADFCWHGVRLIEGLLAYRDWLVSGRNLTA